MTKEYISHDEMIEQTKERIVIGAPRYNDGLRTAIEVATSIPAADVVDVVRCRECKHRIINEHADEKGYLKLKAMCKLDTGDIFELGRNAEDDDWFCADGERKDGGK